MSEMKLKRTPWFPADIEPVRPGFYEVERWNQDKSRKLPGDRLRWTGYHWEYESGTFAIMHETDGDRWRGLAAPAKEEV